MFQLAALGFWIFLAVVAVGGMAYDYYRRRLEMEALRMTLERGQQLDPALLARVLERTGQAGYSAHGSGADDPRELAPYLRIAGVITIASGIGVVPLGALAGEAWPQFRFPLIGLGVLAICVGVGLLIAARVLCGEERGAPPRNPTT